MPIFYNRIHLNSELEEIVKWLKINKLSLNVNKTQCMVFTRIGEKRKVTIKIEDQNIEQVSKMKILIVIIDEQLNWKEHILYMLNKISKAIGVIIKARPLGKKALLSWYYSMISLFDLQLSDLGSSISFQHWHVTLTPKKSYPYYLFNKQIFSFGAFDEGFECFKCEEYLQLFSWSIYV